MAGNYARFFINTSMQLPIPISGHTDYQALPCTVHALYDQTTGSIILETVRCDGRDYDLLQVQPADLRKFYALLAQEAAELFF